MERIPGVMLLEKQIRLQDEVVSGAYTGALSPCSTNTVAASENNLSRDCLHRSLSLWVYRAVVAAAAAATNSSY